MKYKQIGEILNDVYANIIGESETLNEDLSNIVEVGKTITSSDAYGDAFDNYTKKLVDKVGKVLFRENELDIEHLPIYKDSWEFGSIMQKVRVDAPETSEDMTYDLANYTGEDVFKLSIPKASSKFFNNSTTFKLKISLPKKQIKSAWKSASEMSRFISLIENTIKQKLAIDLLALEYRTEVNLIAEKFKAGNSACLINLLERYRDETGDTTVNASNFLSNPNALRFTNKTIDLMRSLLKKPSILYGDGGYTNTTAKNQQTLITLVDFDANLKTFLYSDTYNESYVKLDGYTTVPYWQSGGTNDSYEERSSIRAIPASEGGKEEENRLVIQQENIIALLQDYRASAVTCEYSDVEAINVPDARMVNYWFFEEANYVNDTDENAIVFYFSDYTFVGRLNEEPTDFADNYYIKVDGEYQKPEAFDNSSMYYYKIA